MRLLSVLCNDLHHYIAHVRLPLNLEGFGKFHTLLPNDMCKVGLVELWLSRGSRPADRRHGRMIRRAWLPVPHPQAAHIPLTPYDTLTLRADPNPPFMQLLSALLQMPQEPEGHQVLLENSTP